MQQVSHAERDYHANCADHTREERRAAEACNNILTLTQANVLLLAMDTMPEAAVSIAEWTFEHYGWPEKELDENWLDEAGRVTWKAVQRYRTLAAMRRAA